MDLRVRMRGICPSKRITTQHQTPIAPMASMFSHSRMKDVDVDDDDDDDDGERKRPNEDADDDGDNQDVDGDDTFEEISDGYQLFRQLFSWRAVTHHPTKASVIVFSECTLSDHFSPFYAGQIVPEVIIDLDCGKMFIMATTFPAEDPSDPNETADLDISTMHSYDLVIGAVPGDVMEALHMGQDADDEA
jgi:hypothetical protein